MLRSRVGWWFALGCLTGTLVGCADPQCPGGFEKQGDLCRRIDAGANQESDPVEGVSDAESASSPDAGRGESDASSTAEDGATSADAASAETERDASDGATPTERSGRDAAAADAM